MQFFNHELDLVNEHAQLVDNIWTSIVWKKPISDKKIRINVFQGLDSIILLIQLYMN
jgi:hypothetical protein